MCTIYKSTEPAVLARYRETAALRRACIVRHGRTTIVGFRAADGDWYRADAIAIGQGELDRELARLEPHHPVTVLAVHG